MRNVFAIARRELGSYVDSPLAYFVVPAYVVLVGGFALWFDDLFVGGVASMRTVFTWAAVFQVLLVPAVTMRLFAEEKRSGTLELLATLPIRDEELVAGKFFAALALVVVGVACTFPYVVTLAWLGVPPPMAADAPPFVVRLFTETGLDFGPTVAGYLGLVVLGAALTAIGTAASSLTGNQVVAFLLALLVSVFPYVSGFFLEKMSAELVPWVQWLSFQWHFDNLARGVVDTRDLVFFGGVCGLMLHTAVYSLERRRLA